jgi:hypothetical protein
MMNVVTGVILLIAVIIAGWGQPQIKGPIKTTRGAVIVMSLYTLWVVEVIILVIVAVWSQQ